MQKDVTVYTSNNCASCGMVKKYLTLKNVRYQEVNIEESPNKQDEIVSLTGARTVPVIVVTDQSDEQPKFSVGYNLSQLSSLIA